MMKQKFSVTGMTCSACSSHVEKSVIKTPGVKNASVNLLTNSMQVDYDEETTSSAKIITAVESAGYGASVFGSADTVTAPDKTSAITAMRQRLFTSVLFLIPLLYIAMGHMIYSWLSITPPSFMSSYFLGNANAVTYSFTQLLLLLPIVLINKSYFINGFRTLSKGSPNMDSLIAIGAGASIVYGIFSIYRIGYGLGYNLPSLVEHYRLNLYFESAGMILTLITVGKYLETRAKGKTSDAITKLINLTPKKVTVIKNGTEKLIPADDILVDDIFIIKPGEAAAVDGIVIEGRSAFDEAALTGESIPVTKSPGDKLISASINKTGLIRAKATQVGKNTTIAKIIKLVEDASASKAPIAKLADKVAGVFVPIVIGISCFTGLFWLYNGSGTEFAISMAITVLVISCPCALGLATPVAIMVGTGKGAQNGILIKSGEALETAHAIDTIVLDKTGTITAGKPIVTDIICTDSNDENSLLKIAGSIEKGSEHPLAEAIINRCETNAIKFATVTDFKALLGLGAEGCINGQKYYAGNINLLHEKGIYINDIQNKIIQKLAQKGKTPLIFADTQKIIGIIAVADTIKPDSKTAVQKLKANGLNVIMLTGDNKITAHAIKSQVGIDNVIADVLPTQKEAQITALKNSGHKVAMVGDGINDAPALAAADVGIAIGAGTDIAIESADIVLMKSNLLDVVNTMHLSKAVIRNIKENLFWAFFYNIIGIPIAAGLLYPLWGIRLNPMFAAAAMSLSSVCVVTNALRLRNLRLDNSQNNTFPPNSNIIVQKEKGANKMKTVTIMIEGMSCNHCTNAVTKALQSVNGVDDVKVSLEKKNAVVTADNNISVDILKNAVINAGYDVIDLK